METIVYALIRLQMSVVIRYRRVRVSVIIWDGPKVCIGLTAYWSIYKHGDKLSWRYTWWSTLMTRPSTVFQEEHAELCGFLVPRIGASMMDVCEMRMIDDAWYFEARYKRGGLQNQSFQAEASRAVSCLISVSQSSSWRNQLSRLSTTFAQPNAENIRQGSEKGGGDLSLEVYPPFLCSDKRDNPHDVSLPQRCHVQSCCDKEMQRSR